MASSKVEDPRQLAFLKYYLTPGTPLFNNALQSALKAGYAQEYAESILQKDLKWLDEGIAEIVGKPTDKKNLVAKAKRVLDKSLDSTDEKISQDTAKFIAKTDVEFAEKQDPEANKPQEVLVRFIGDEK
jgi:phage terminase small subunit